MKKNYILRVLPVLEYQICPLAAPKPTIWLQYAKFTYYKKKCRVCLEEFLHKLFLKIKLIFL